MSGPEERNRRARIKVTLVSNMLTKAGLQLKSLKLTDEQQHVSTIGGLALPPHVTIFRKGGVWSCAARMKTVGVSIPRYPYSNHFDIKYSIKYQLLISTWENAMGSSTQLPDRQKCVSLLGSILSSFTSSFQLWLRNADSSPDLVWVIKKAFILKTRFQRWDYSDSA